MDNSEFQNRNLKFRCKICQYETFHKSSLTTHMKTHSAERPWKCAVCFKTFKLKHHLKHHLITHNRKSIFKCHLCTFRSNSNLSLQLHRQSRHGTAIPQINMHKNLNVVNKYAKDIYTRMSSQNSLGVQSSSGQYHHPTNVMSSHTIDFAMPPNHCPISPLTESENLPKITRISSNESQIEENVTDQEWGQNSAFFEEASQDTKITSTPSVMANKSGDRDLCEPSTSVVNRESNCDETNNSCTSPASNNITSSSSGFSEVVNQAALDVTEPVQHHGESSRDRDREEKWECTPCGITFPDNIMYGLHTACHSVHQPYRCNICGKLCRDRYDFTFHITMGKHEGNN